MTSFYALRNFVHIPAKGVEAVLSVGTHFRVRMHICLMVETQPQLLETVQVLVEAGVEAHHLLCSSLPNRGLPAQLCRTGCVRFWSVRLHWEGWGHCSRLAGECPATKIRRAGDCFWLPRFRVL